MNKLKKKSKIFNVLQKLGKSFMFPIAILPIAGVMLGIGSSFTNPITISSLHLEGVIYQGSTLFSIFSIMNGVGSAIFDNLPLIFAIGVAIGMVDKNKETASLAAALSYIVMNVTINKILLINNIVDADGNIIANIADGVITKTLGITTLQVGVFGGIIVGIIVSYLHNKFCDIKLPEYLAFFGGNRFVPIISVFASIIVGFVFSLVWPTIQYGIVYLGDLVAKGGLIGVFFFENIKRLLVPFGLHHIFYLPFWQTAIGGTATVAGVQYVGAQNILFAQLADVNTVHLSREYAMYFSGAYPIMLFGIPAACLAIYKNAKEENKKQTKSLMISAAVASFLTGITEPVEFPILFASPILYFVHSICYGISNVAMYLLNVTVGSTFSDGFIDLFLLGILPGNQKTSWLYIIPIGLIFFAVYYFVFNFAIKKFDLKTPGREEFGNDIKVNAIEQDASDMIVSGLGGIENIVSYDCCATRLRVDVVDGSLVSDSELKNTGALGIMKKETAVQVIYGPMVGIVKEKLEKYINSGGDGSILIRSPLVGKFIPLEEVPDEAFATKTLGEGIAVEPDDPYVYAPADGKIIFIYPTKHAIGFMCDNGVSLLIHLGMDTAELKGEGLEALVQQGDNVKLGTKIIKMDLNFLKKKAKTLISPVIVSDLSPSKKIEIIADKHIEYNESVMRIVNKD
ncbi:MAG: glucose PTS transporter subunit IIA [Erysipelotrichaceae bacterium]|nr:glucose PTS transporter subunit IIA [Erysipelotrichaceae bacterium]